VQIIGLIKDVKVIVVAKSSAHLNDATFTDGSSLSGSGSDGSGVPHGHVVRVVDPLTEDVAECVLEETGGLGVDAILDLQRRQPSPTRTATATSTAKKTSDSKGTEAKDKAASAADAKAEGAAAARGQNARGEAGDVDAETGVGGGAEQKRASLRVSARTVLRCLAVQGKWCTGEQNMSLTAADCRQLFLRSASLCFLFEMS
jgi:hypothetical protein